MSRTAQTVCGHHAVTVEMTTSVWGVYGHHGPRNRPNIRGRLFRVAILPPPGVNFRTQLLPHEEFFW